MSTQQRQQQGGMPLSTKLAAGAALAVLAASAAVYFGSRPRGQVGGGADPGAAPSAAVSSSSELDAKSSLQEISDGLARSDGMALAVYLQRLTPTGGAPAAAMGEPDSAEWLDSLANLRAGYPRFSAYGRASALSAATRLMARYALAPTPPDWPTLLSPSFDLFSAAMSDSDPGVRATAAREIGGLWSWAPGRDLFTAEQDHLTDWKESLHKLSLRGLGDPEPMVRASAVAALGALPLPEQAAPAIAYLKDPSPEVRGQVLAGFQDRRELLDEEMILPLLFDPTAEIAAMAEQLLKRRGLTNEQIGMGKLVVHPMPKMRASAITLMKERTDIDPTVWLVYLSRDLDEEVRAKAVEALAANPTAEARERLTEIAASDASPSIREAAARVVGVQAPAQVVETSALPALPGSSRLAPKAN